MSPAFRGRLRQQRRLSSLYRFSQSLRAMEPDEVRLDSRTIRPPQLVYEASVVRRHRQDGGTPCCEAEVSEERLPDPPVALAVRAVATIHEENRPCRGRSLEHELPARLERPAVL